MYSERDGAMGGVCRARGVWLGRGTGPQDNEVQRAAFGSQHNEFLEAIRSTQDSANNRRSCLHMSLFEGVCQIWTHHMPSLSPLLIKSTVKHITSKLFCYKKMFSTPFIEVLF